MAPRVDGEHVRSLFDRVSAQPRDGWEAALRAELKTGADPAVLSRVRDLLNMVSDGSSAPAAAPPSSQRTIGRYTIIRILGEGGMGVVYEARQEHPRRTVALKVLRAGSFSAAALKRFEREADVLGRLKHPCIASVYETGSVTDSDGAPIPFFAMEFIAGGKTITDFAAARQLDLPARLTLFAEACDAVHYAHMRSVVHRDLKPANILVDTGGRPRIIDFGVVKLTDSDVHTTLGTAAGEIVGTLQYMSPEQCDGDPHTIDLRSDVYSLGVVLYELVCRRTPYNVAGKRLVDALQIIRGHEPAKPSKLVPGLSGDLDAIILKAMARNPDHRYQSVHGLGLDLRRYLAREPVHARAGSATYLLQKVLFRWRREALLAFLAISVILLSLSRLINEFSWVAAAALAGAPIAVIILAAVSFRANTAHLRRLRKELAEAREQLARLEALHRSAEVDARRARDRFDTVQLRASEAVVALAHEAQRLGATRELQEAIDLIGQRILSTAREK